MNRIKRYLSERVLKEIAENPIRNLHGINEENITRHLVIPRLETYIDLRQDDLKFGLWTVLEETPGKTESYIIFYDPELDMFGLGLKGKTGKLIYLGDVGSFLNTLEGM